MDYVYTCSSTTCTCRNNDMSIQRKTTTVATGWLNTVKVEFHGHVHVTYVGGTSHRCGPKYFEWGPKWGGGRGNNL